MESHCTVTQDQTRTLSVVDDIEVGDEAGGINVHEQPALSALRVHPTVENALNRTPEPFNASPGDIALMQKRKGAHALHRTWDNDVLPSQES